MKYLVFIISLYSLAHPGATIKSGPKKGCHKNTKTGEFHCHGKNLKESYSRDDFGDWNDEDGDCQDTRAEVLIQRSEIPITLNKKGCSVISGKWRDFYFDEVLLKASEVDIDHVVPLKHAYEAGAKEWNHEKKIKFANDPENLVITNLKYNRQKGAKTPLEWMPVEKSYSCRYLTKWLSVKTKYGLTVTPNELRSKSNVCIN